MAIQQKVGVDFRPFLLYWGLLLVPSILVWTAFVIVIQTITQNRYTTYALALAIALLHGISPPEQGQINWVGNWPLWSAVQAQRHQHPGAGSPGDRSEPGAGYSA